IDFCSQVDGCTHLNNNNPCDDGDACTVGDICAGGVCTAGAPADCGDGNVCTDDACDPVLGCTHTNNDLPCSDGNACTENDACAGGVCVGGPAVDCDDNNVCTIDFCSQVDGCTHLNNNNPCDDGNACTVGDTCSGGSCIPGSPVDCSDGVACTDDACDQVTGCSHTPNNAACDDGDVCTDDVCDVNTGCTHTNNTAPCDDADACTTNDMCSNGACVGVPPPALVVDAGADMTVLLGDPVLLNGTACDPDFATGALLPLWEVTVADCPVSSIVVSNPFAFVTSVDVQETCTFDLRLTVTNPNSNSAEDFLTVTVNLCGDGVCNLTEDCGSCPQDCPCPDGFICDAGACVCVTGCR
ncbi:MAG: hypothetical protein ACE5HE_12260, partial [Phycisphaerae bacterium]